MKLCCLSIINMKTTLQDFTFIFPTSVSVHWCYRFFNVQFSSDVADVRCPMCESAELLLSNCDEIQNNLLTPDEVVNIIQILTGAEVNTEKFCPKVM